MPRLAKALPSIASALLLTLAFPPFSLRLLVFVALAPWLASLPRLGARGAFKSGYAFGLVYLAGQFHWLEALTARWTGSEALALLPWTLATALGSLYFGLIGWLCWVCWERKLLLAAPLAWAGVEVFRSYIPVLAFPYGLLASPLWPYPALIQSAQVGLIYLTSAWIFLGNLLLAQAWVRIRVSRLGLALFFMMLGASLALYLRPIEGDAFRVASGQPGVDLAFGPAAQNALDVRRNVASLEAQATASGAQLLVLPEGIAESGELPIDTQLPTIYGGPRGSGPVYQDAYAVEGSVVTHADKTRLVIFGEFVPGRRFLPFLDRFHLPSGDMQAGQEVQALWVSGVVVGPVICFEGLFPDIAYRQYLNGAQLLAVISVDDWYQGTGALEQLKSASIFRAVETNLPLIRSATQGYSLVVDQRGRILAEAPLKVCQAVLAKVALPASDGGFAWKFLFPFAALTALPVLISVRVWTKKPSS